MTVRDVMTPKVLTIAADETMENAGIQMTEAGVHQLVVRGKRGGVVGVVGRGDISGAPRTARIRDYMPRRLLSVHPDTPIGHAAALMRAYAIGSLPVISGRRLVGIVTVSDILDLVEGGDALPGTNAAVRPKSFR
jgi:CBS domain-containing protein